MQINRKQLVEALAIVKPGLAGKEIIAQTTSFAFLGDEVVTYNDEISVRCPVPGLDLTGAIKAESLYQFLNKVKQDEIHLEITEKEIIVSAGKSRAGLALEAEITLPLEEVGKRAHWVELPETFLRFLKMASNTCAIDLSRPILTCVNIQPSGLIQGSDGYRLLRCMSEEMDIEEVLLPRHIAVEVVKFAPTHIANGDGWVHFKNAEEAVLSCRIFEEAYPNTEKFASATGQKITFPKTLVEGIEKASVFSKQDHYLDEKIQIEIKDRKLTITADNVSCWYEESLNIKYEGDVIRFLVTPYLFVEMLGDTQDCIVGKDRLKFEGGSWVYLAMLRGEG